MSTAKKVGAAAGGLIVLAAVFVAPIGTGSDSSSGGAAEVLCRPAGSAAVPISAPAVMAPVGSVKVTVPMVGKYLVTSNFGSRWGTLHGGIDLASAGPAPTLAFMAGTVTFAGPNGGAGNMVQIDHGSGLVTVYMHHSQVLVKVGDVVAAGQQIGVQGTTGDSSGPHLHFEIHVNGTKVDPRPYAAGVGVVLPAEGAWGEGPPAPGQASAATGTVGVALPECAPGSTVIQAGNASGGVSATAVPAWALPWVLKAGSLCVEIPPAIIAAQIDQESKWNKDAVNAGSGASGLTQFMPGTWAGIGRDDDGNGKVSPFDAGDAIMAQGRYGCQLVGVVKAAGIAGDATDLALAAYNAGPGNVINHGGIPPFRETQEYVPLIRGMATGKYAATK